MPRSSPELERRAAAAVAASRTAAPERHPFPALPPGWAVIGRCRFGTGVPGPDATGCYALAHPDVGVALMDIAPDATPNAEARLRRALTAVDFWPDYPGTLPVVHDRVDGTALRSLPWVLERGFAAQPGLTISGGTAWIEGVQRAMAADPAWELPGQPKAQADDPPAPVDEAEGGDEALPPPPRSRPVRPRRWGRLAALSLAFAATFAVGLVAGFVLLDTPAPVAPQPVVATVATPAQPAPAPTAPSSAAVPADTAPRPAETAASVVTTPAATTPSAAGTPAPAPGATVVAAPVPGPAAAPASPAATPAPVSQPPALPSADATPPLAPAELAAAPNGIGGSGGGNGAPSPATSNPPMETQVSLAAPVEPALPVAPPPAPAPPPIRVSSAQQAARPAPVIDRACSQALFRFQQGERLTAAEQNFVRTGCSTGRGR
jgi:hypothetical protein